MGTRVLPTLFKRCPWVDIDLFGGEFVYYSYLIEQWKFLSTRGQCHSMAFDSKLIFWQLKTNGLDINEFHAEPPGADGTKICFKGPGHMTNMDSMPRYGKNLEKSSTLYPVGQRHWYASDTQLLPRKC